MAEFALPEILVDVGGAGKMLSEELQCDVDLALTRRLSLVCKSWHAALAEEVRRRCAEVVEFCTAKDLYGPRALFDPNMGRVLLYLAIGADSLEAFNLIHLNSGYTYITEDYVSFMDKAVKKYAPGSLEQILPRKSILRRKSILHRILEIMKAKCRRPEDGLTDEISVVSLAKNLEALRLYDEIIGLNRDDLDFGLDGFGDPCATLLDEAAKDRATFAYLVERFDIPTEFVNGRPPPFQSAYLNKDAFDYLIRVCGVDPHEAEDQVDYEQALHEMVADDRYYERLLEVAPDWAGRHLDLPTNLLSTALATKTRSGRCLKWIMGALNIGALEQNGLEELLIKGNAEDFKDMLDVAPIYKREPFGDHSEILIEKAINKGKWRQLKAICEMIRERSPASFEEPELARTQKKARAMIKGAYKKMPRLLGKRDLLCAEIMMESFQIKSVRSFAYLLELVIFNRSLDTILKFCPRKEDGKLHSMGGTIGSAVIYERVDFIRWLVCHLPEIREHSIEAMHAVVSDFCGQPTRNYINDAARMSASRDRERLEALLASKKEETKKALGMLLEKLNEAVKRL